MKNKDENKKKKLGLKGASIAMVVAILSLLGFGWNSTDWGEGNVGNQDSSGQIESQDSQEQAQSEESEAIEQEAEEALNLEFFVYEDKIYTDKALTQEISLNQIEQEIEAYKGQEVFLYDAGAIKQTFEEVEQIIDVYVDSHGLIKVKSEINE